MAFFLLFRGLSHLAGNTKPPPRACKGLHLSKLSLHVGSHFGLTIAFHADRSMSPDVEQPKPRPEELVPPLQQGGFIVANPGNEFVVGIEIHTDGSALDSRTKTPAESEDASL
jgi:hypothetical protein